MRAWEVGVPDDKALRKVQSVVEVQSRLHKVLDKVQANHGVQREAASPGNLPNFSVGEYVLVLGCGAAARRKNFS